MRKAPFNAAVLSSNVQRFLFACAFWTVAADEELKPAEQQWLIAQFGKEQSSRWLDEFAGFENADFFAAFDQTSDALTEQEKKQVFPQLEPWLISCATSDGSTADHERQVIRRIKERIFSPATIRHWTESSSQTRPEPVRTFKGHTAEVTCLSIAAEGRLMLSGSEDGMVRLWDLEGGLELATLIDAGVGVQGVCVSPDGNKALAGDRAGRLYGLDLPSGKILWKVEGLKKGGITGVAVSPDGVMGVSSSNTGYILLLEMETGRILRQTGNRRYGAFNDLVLAPDGHTVLSGGDDGVLRFWNAREGVELGTLAGHRDGVMSVRISPDGRYAISGSRDHTVRLWEIGSGTEKCVLEGHTFSVYGVRFTLDGRHAVSASWDHSVRVWDMETEMEVCGYFSTNARFSCVACDSLSRYIAVGSSENDIRLFSLPGMLAWA